MLVPVPALAGIQPKPLVVQVTRKNIKNMYIRVHAPAGAVCVSAPVTMPTKQIQAAVRTRIDWIRQQQQRLAQAVIRPEPKLITGESIYLWGQPYQLFIHDLATKAFVTVTENTINLFVRPGANLNQRQQLLEKFYRQQLSEQIPLLMEKWQPIIGVTASSWHIKKMKTRWGSCNTRVGRIWLNLSLATKLPKCLEYVVVHELVHLLEPSHNHRFKGFMSQFLPDWRARKTLLNS